MSFVPVAVTEVNGNADYHWDNDLDRSSCQLNYLIALIKSGGSIGYEWTCGLLMETEIKMNLLLPSLLVHQQFCRPLGTPNVKPH